MAHRSRGHRARRAPGLRRGAHRALRGRPVRLQRRGGQGARLQPGEGQGAPARSGLRRTASTSPGTSAAAAGSRTARCWRPSPTSSRPSGVRVKLNLMEVNQLLANQNNATFQVGMIRWSRTYDPDTTIAGLRAQSTIAEVVQQRGGRPPHRARAARRSTGPRARRSTRRSTGRMVDDPPYIYLHAQDSVWAKRASSDLDLQRVRRQRVAVPALQVAAAGEPGCAPAAAPRPAASDAALPRPSTPAARAHPARRHARRVPARPALRAIPTQLLLPDTADAEDRALFRQQHGLDRPLADAVRCAISATSCAAISAARWWTAAPRSARCSSACPPPSSWRWPASLIAVLVGIPVGVLSAVRRGLAARSGRHAGRPRRPVHGHVLGRHPAHPGLRGAAPVAARCRGATAGGTSSCPRSRSRST